MTLMTYVKGDDWEGIYIGDKLRVENHSISIDEVMKLSLKYNADRFEVKHANLKWLNNVGNLPNYLDEVKLKD